MQQLLVAFAAEVVAAALIALITTLVRRWVRPRGAAPVQLLTAQSQIAAG